MRLYTVLWVVVATVFCMLSQKRQLPRRYAIEGHEPVEVYPESFGRIEVKPISNWRGWGGIVVAVVTQGFRPRAVQLCRAKHSNLMPNNMPVGHREQMKCVLISRTS